MSCEHFIKLFLSLTTLHFLPKFITFIFNAVKPILHVARAAKPL